MRTQETDCPAVLAAAAASSGPFSPAFTMPRFPSPNTANDDGLVAVGGELTPEWLLEAYSQGIFPWPFDDEERWYLGWFAPDPRAILEPEALHISRRLGERLRSGRFQTTINGNFSGVIRGCAAPRGDDAGTWLVPPMIAAYERLHALGYALSVEVWCEPAVAGSAASGPTAGEHIDSATGLLLAGGVYGVKLGRYFSAESMFHRVTDASKVALVRLVEHLRAEQVELLDVQVSSPHLTRLGATEIPRLEFLKRLKLALRDVK